jgi:hypothetical protein
MAGVVRSVLCSTRSNQHAEGERIKREISGYLQLNQVAMGSTKLVVNNIAQCRAAAAATAPRLGKGRADSSCRSMIATIGNVVATGRRMKGRDGLMMSARPANAVTRPGGAPRPGHPQRASLHRERALRMQAPRTPEPPRSPERIRGP